MPHLIDATVLSNFAAVERLDLLGLALGDAGMAAAVFAEVRRGIEDGYEFLRAIEAQIYPLKPNGWLRLIDVEGQEEHDRHVRLSAVVHPGEAASLAIAAHRGWVFATDDRAARRFAAEEGVAVTGTLGILLELVNEGALSLDDANGLLILMIDRAHYRSPVTDLSVLLDRE